MVMHEGKASATFTRDEATQEQLMAAAVGKFNPDSQEWKK